MGVGLPVVATGHCGTGDLIGSDNLSDDSAAWIEQAAKLVRERAARRDLGAKMRKCVEKHYAFSSTAKEIEGLVIELLGSEAEAEFDGPSELDTIGQVQVSLREAA